MEILDLFVKRVLEGKCGELGLGRTCEYHAHAFGDPCSLQAPQSSTSGYNQKGRKISTASMDKIPRREGKSAPPMNDVSVTERPNFQNFLKRMRNIQTPPKHMKSGKQSSNFKTNLQIAFEPSRPTSNGPSTLGMHGIA